MEPEWYNDCDDNRGLVVIFIIAVLVAIAALCS